MVYEVGVFKWLQNEPKYWKWRFADLSHDVWRNKFCGWRLTFWRWLFTLGKPVTFDFDVFEKRQLMLVTLATLPIPYKNAPLINHWEITDFPLIYFSMILGIKIGTWLSLTMHWLIIDLSWDYWMINADFLLIVKWYSLISHWIFHDYHVISDW